MSELADEADSKSVGGNVVRVQVPPPALKTWLYSQVFFCSMSLSPHQYSLGPCHQASFSPVLSSVLNLITLYPHLPHPNITYARCLRLRFSDVTMSHLLLCVFFLFFAPLPRMCTSHRHTQPFEKITFSVTLSNNCLI